MTLFFNIVLAFDKVDGVEPQLCFVFSLIPRIHTLLLASKQLAPLSNCVVNLYLLWFIQLFVFFFSFFFFFFFSARTFHPLQYLFLIFSPVGVYVYEPIWSHLFVLLLLHRL